MPADAAARRRVLDLLACPLCGGALGEADGAVRCGRRHTFDVARQGYVSLLTGRAAAANADTAEMVEAREAFLRTGRYASLADAMAWEAVTRCPADGTVLDAGAGTGYYLARVLDALPGAAGLGLDLSKFALRRAARAHPRLTAAVWDVWRPLPLRDGSVDLVLNVFAPRNAPQFARVLRPGGLLFVATPEAAHLRELREELGLLAVDDAKEERLRIALGEHFTHESTHTHRGNVVLSAEEAENVVFMGPSAHHLDRAETRRRIAALGPAVRVGTAVRFTVHRRR